MLNSKLINLLRQLNSTEIVAFGEFIHSPIFNKRIKIHQLVAFLLDFAPKFDHPKLAKDEAQKVIFETAPITNTAFNNLLSDTLQLAYDFLAFREFQSNQFLQKELLAQQLIQRNAFKHAEKEMRKWQKLLDKQQHLDGNYFSQQLAFHQKGNQFFLQKIRRGYDVNLQKMYDNLNADYILKILIIACEMASRNVVTQAQYDLSPFEDILVFLEQQGKLRNFPSVEIYHQIFLLITQNDSTSYYHQVKELLQEHTQVLSKDSLKDIYAYLLNYCIRQINLGKTTFYAEIFAWYKVVLAEEIILENKQLSDKSFMNIVTSSLRMEAFAWTEKFIKDYQLYLKSAIRENAVAYNRAALYFAQKEYNKALLQLVNVEFTDSIYHIGAQIIQLKSYFYLQETEAYFSLIQSLKQYIQRNKFLSTYQKSANLNFLNLAKRSFQLQLSKTLIPKQNWQQKHQLLCRKLEQTHPLSNKEWLLASVGI